MRLSRIFALGLVLLGGASLGADEPPGASPVENRLAKERSPYLRQHKTNPVDWYPWGAEALERARTTGKPIFLSVGYAACHWCHVMEHESFEDPGTARLLNDTFVCVKVDREERPDLDRVYMTAVQAISGRGGWPMTVLLTPDGRPFHAGTYYPRATLHDLVRKVKQAWATDRTALDQHASVIAGRVKELLGSVPDDPGPTGSDDDVLQRLEGALVSAFDARHGGFGHRPKFPPHSELLLLLDRAAAPGGERGLALARTTLAAMEEGGIHDQVGGGFHRYSTDERWLVPHFEKMLYDNALLAQSYAALFERTREPRFARTARRILAWVARELARPGGGYASSLDADTEGHEGLTYTWTVAEVRGALAPADADLVLQVLGILPEGNFDDEATGRPTQRNIPHFPAPLAEAAKARGLAPDGLLARLDPLLLTLRKARDARAQPGLDDKVIAAWNGLLLSAFARVGAALGDAALLESGRALAGFLLREHRRADGTLLRFPRGSGPEIPGFAEDLVHVGEGLLDLAEAAKEPHWADEARKLADDLLLRFEDPGAGGVWATADAAHETLIARAKEIWDNPIPSDNGTAARLLLRLAARTGEARYRAAADRILAAYRPLLARAETGRGVVALARALALRSAIDRAAPRADDVGRGDANVRQGVVEADAWLERGEARPGSVVRYAVRLKLDTGWHVNGPEAPAGRVATALALAEKSPVNLGPVRWPDAVEVVPGAPPGFAGTVWIRGELHVPPGAVPGPRRVSLLLTLQACEATSCQAAEDVRLDLALRFGDADAPPRHPAVFPR